jgi:hypothetical protein
MGVVVFSQISKGGTNMLHGSAQEYLQNNGLNAAGHGLRQRVTPGRPLGPVLGG